MFFAGHVSTESEKHVNETEPSCLSGISAIQRSLVPPELCKRSPDERFVLQTRIRSTEANSSSYRTQS